MSEYEMGWQAGKDHAEQETREQSEAVEAALAADRLAALRDVFAAAAMSGMIASCPATDRTKVDKQVWSWVAYNFADAMMDAREHTPADIAGFLRGRGL